MTFAATHVLAAVPVISSFTPTNGAPGTSVTLSGQNFSGVTIVTFNNSQAIISAANASTIVATVPLDATTGPLSVTTPGGTGVSARSFYVAPRITGFDPPIAAIGATISIQGFNFGGTTAVNLGPYSQRVMLLPKRWSLHKCQWARLPVQ